MIKKFKQVNVKNSEYLLIFIIFLPTIDIIYKKHFLRIHLLIKKEKLLVKNNIIYYNKW